MKKEMLIYHKKAGSGYTKRTEDAELYASAGLDRILCDRVTVTAEPGNLQDGKGTVNGTIIFFALWQNEEGNVKRSEKRVDFSEEIFIKNATPDMYMTVKAEVLGWDMRISGDRIIAKADIQIEATAWEKKEQPFLTELDEEDVEQKTECKAFMKMNGAVQKHFDIQDQAELSRDNPPIYEILSVNGKINPSSMRAVNGKAVVQAELDTVILYTDSETMQLCTASVSIPFTEIFEVEDLSDEELFLQELKIEDISFSALPDEKGEVRVIDLNVKACLNAERFIAQNETFVTDCFGVGKSCDTVCDNISVRIHAGDMNGQAGLKGQIEIGEMPQIGQVYFLEAIPKIRNFESEDNGCTVSGNVLVCVHYITDEETQKIAVLEKEIPFSERFACTGKAEPHCKLRASGMSYTLNGDYVVDVRGNLEFSGVLLREEPMEVIRALSVGPCEAKTDFPSVTVCFAQNGEGLWDIAKKYAASIKEIAETNGLSENANVSGKRLIVPKHK